MPLSHLPFDVLIDALLLVVLTGVGCRLIRSLFAEDGLLRILVGCAVGLFLFSIFIFVVAALGVLRLQVVGPALLAMAAFGLKPLIVLSRTWNKRRAKDTGRLLFQDPFQGILLLFLASASLFNLFFGYAPPTGEDELHYHISLPALFVYWGRWVNTRGVFSSFFPLNGQFIYTGVLLLRNVFAVKAMVWMTGLLMVLALYAFARRYFRLERREAILAATLFYTSPMMTSYNGITSVAMINIFFEILSVALFWEWTGTRDRKILLLMAFLSGAGMGMRLYAFPWVVAIALGIVFFEKRPREALLFCSVAGLLYAPWWIRNYLLTGNPVYPVPLWKGAAHDTYQMAMFTPGGYWRKGLELPLFLSFGAFIWGMGPLVWSLAPFAVFRKDLVRERGRLVLLTLVILVLLHLIPSTRFNARYYDGAFPWIVLFSAVGFSTLLARSTRGWQRFLKTWVVALLIFPNLALSVYFGSQRIPYLLGRQSENEYLRNHYPGHEGFDMFQYLRQNLSPDNTLLRLGDLPSTNAFYFPAHHIITMSEYPPAFYACSTPKQFAQALAAKGIKSVLLEKPSFEEETAGFWRYRDLPTLGIRLPPFASPSFQKTYETPEAILYRVTAS